MESKTSKVIELLNKGLEDEALKIGKGFRIGDKKLIDTIRRGYDASRNPNFYLQIKLDPNQLYKEAIEALKQLVNI